MPLRKMISVAPGETILEHPLIRTLIELGHFDAADTEIKTFRSDFKIYAPTTRYLINLATARAVRAKGLMEEDRVVLIRKAEEIAIEASRKYKNVKGVLVAYCEVGIDPEAHSIFTCIRRRYSAVKKRRGADRRC